MCRVYSLFRSFATYWLAFVLLLIGATVTLGMNGFEKKSREEVAHERQVRSRVSPDEPLSQSGLDENQWATNLYLTALLFALNSGDVARNVNPELGWARWLGFAVWFITVVSVLIRLFSQTALVGLVRGMAWLTWRFRSHRHVIVAGLGRPDSDRERLVQRLRAQKRNVVVVEPDADHPGLEACRQVGAICLIGSPFEATMMRKAGVTWAGSVLALSDDDRKNVTFLSLTSALLGGPSDTAPVVDENPLTPPNPDDLQCVVQVSEPRLLEVLRRHRLQRDANDRLHLRIFSMHELVARAMIRESLIGMAPPVLNKVLLLGTGAQGRLGEVLVLRLLKDRWIDWDHGNPNNPIAPLHIDVFDQDADDWVQCMTEGFDPAMAALCTLHPQQCQASQCGFRAPAQRTRLLAAGYDAVFVCLSNEPLATIQAAQLRSELPTVPIVVRVHEEESGFGQLLRDTPDAGGLGSNIRVVGTHDRVFDIAASLNPMVEIFAQVLHQDYLLLTEQRRQALLAANKSDAAAAIMTKAAFKPWRDLDHEYKESNRALAERLTAHLIVPAHTGNPPRRYEPIFCARELMDPAGLFQLSAPERAALARQEHELWLKAMKKSGWRLGSGAGGPQTSDPIEKLNPYLVEWEKLDPDVKNYDENIIRRLPYIFAKADYKLVEVV